MPKLKNQRLELLAQGIFSGLKDCEAYRRAGYKGRANGQAWKAVHRPEVVARVAELNARLVKNVVLSKAQAIEMLSRGAVAAFRFMEKAGVFGNRKIEMDPDKIEDDPELKLAVREVTMRDDGTSTVKLHDYKDALALLAKLEGWEAPKTLELKGARSIAEATDEELQALLKTGKDQAPHGGG